MGEVLEDMLEKAEAQQADGQKAEMVPKSQRCGFGDVSRLWSASQGLGRVVLKATCPCLAFRSA